MIYPVDELWTSMGWVEKKWKKFWINTKKKQESYQMANFIAITKHSEEIKSKREYYADAILIVPSYRNLIQKTESTDST